MVFDFDNNGRYDLITLRHNSSYVGNNVTYELLTPYVVLDNGSVKEITNLWKGGTEITNGDYNADGYNDIAVFDDGPEYWSINPNPPKTPVVVYWNSKNGFTGENTKVCDVYQNSFSLISGKFDGKKDVLVLGVPNSDTYWEFDGTAFKNVAFTNIEDIKGFTMNQHLYDDFDNDGKADLLMYNKPIPKLAFNILNRTKVFDFKLPLADALPSRAIAGDFRKVGRKDVIFVTFRANPETHMVYENKHYYFYYENNGDGTFTLNKDIFPVDGIYFNSYGTPNYVVVDYNNDGYLDFYNINSSMDAFFMWDKTTNKFKKTNRYGL
jgi:hypothetical protein